jgi:hypothetical protein
LSARRQARRIASQPATALKARHNNTKTRNTIAV